MSSIVKVIIGFDSRFVLSCQDDSVKPVEWLKSQLKEKMPSVSITSVSLQELEVELDTQVCSVDAFRQEVEQWVTDQYHPKKKGLSFIVENGEATPDSAGSGTSSDIQTLLHALSAATPAQTPAPAPTAETPAVSLSGNGFSAEAPAGTPPTSVEKTLAEIDQMMGGKAFKDLAREIVRIAPQVIKCNTYDVFIHQSYIFSINEGHGLSAYLQLLLDLLGAVQINRTATIGQVSEEKLDPPDGTSMAPFKSALQAMRLNRKGTLNLVCIDISEWMTHINTKMFRDFLSELEKSIENTVVVFRIPFVEMDVLNRIAAGLSDLMFVRCISFPPFNISNLRAFASRELEKYGFRMTNAAWKIFDHKIAEEKSDGRFYGIHTVQKVVREMIYKKQLHNAHTHSDDTLVSKKDLTGLCSQFKDNGISGMEQLKGLVGAEKIVERVEEILSQIELARANDLSSPCLHMRFVGNPGTGKTTVARIVGQILKERGVLRVGSIFEYAGRDFCGRYIGETAPKVSSMCRDAYGSVLFIDEAYSLYRGDDNDRDYGREALDTLIAEMENHRTDLVVIMPGYPDEMETLMRGNAGLASRMPYIIEFPNFTRDELFFIFKQQLKKAFGYDEDLLTTAENFFKNLPEAMVTSKSFSNARFVRNLFERTWAKAAMRCQLNGTTQIHLTSDDFNRAAAEKEFGPLQDKRKTIGFT